MSEDDRPRHFSILPTSLRQWLSNLNLSSPSTSSPVDTETAAALQSIQGAVRTRMQQATEERRVIQNQIQEVFSQIEAALQSGSPSLVRTIIERFCLREVSLEELNENLPVSTDIRRLRIKAKPEQRISSNQLQLIGKKFPHITELDLSGTSLRDAGFATLAQQPYVSRLTHLNISTNFIRSDAIRERIGAFVSLTSLDISNNFVQDAGLVAIAQQPFAQNLTYLNISSTGILLGRSVDFNLNKSISLAKIKTSLDAFKSLKRLNISKNSIRNAEFALLAQSSFAPYLTDLNISDTQITANGIESNKSKFPSVVILIT